MNRERFAQPSDAHAATSAYTQLYSFKGVPDGEYPMKRLLQFGGNLYGTTYEGGTGKRLCGQGCGTVFEVGLAGNESVVYSFKNYPDGATPEAGLTNVKGELFGTTYSGGNERRLGTVFELSPGTESVVHVFTGPPDGKYPAGGLINVKGILYGTTAGGGRRVGPCHRGGCGTVFAIDASGSERVVYAFKPPPDGGSPLGTLAVVDGEFYGTTEAGGAYGKGTVFTVNSSGAEHVVYSFRGPPDGEYPAAGIVDVKGKLYGTTETGGTTGGGTVFALSPSGKESVLYSFGYGSYPQGGLIYVNGYLYGTTPHGGGGYPGSGVVFKISPAGKESTVYHFKGGTDGKAPSGGLINVNGTLYGTTERGGASDFGTVFAVSP